MEKGIKIKVFTVFMAWVVIFLHSVIPHNHQHDQYAELKSLIHYSSSFQIDNQTQTTLWVHNSTHKEVCTYTENLFHQLHTDDLFPDSSENVQLIPPIDLSGDLIFEKEEVVPFFLHYSNSLRAPPLSQV